MCLWRWHLMTPMMRRKRSPWKTNDRVPGSSGTVRWVLVPSSGYDVVSLLAKEGRVLARTSVLDLLERSKDEPTLSREKIGGKILVPISGRITNDPGRRSGVKTIVAPMANDGGPVCKTIEPTWEGKQHTIKKHKTYEVVKDPDT